MFFTTLNMGENMKIVKNIVMGLALIIILIVGSFSVLLIAEEFQNPKRKNIEEALIIDDIEITKNMKDNGSVSFTSALSFDLGEMKALAIGFALYDIYEHKVFYTIDCQKVGYNVTIASFFEGSAVQISLIDD